MTTDLLGSLRSIVASEAAAPAAANSDRDYAALTDFTTLPDFAGYRRMRQVFGEGGTFPDLYFLPRHGRMGPVIDTPVGRKILFSGYDYLGLGSDARIVAAAAEALSTYGGHAGAARMVGGEIDLHRRLETALAAFTGHVDAVVGVGGYGANVAVLAYLLGRNDLLVHDAMMHNSGVAGGVQSGAKRLAFPHADYDALERVLATHRDRAQRAIILVEGAYSMDGDIADLPRLLDIKRRWGCWLMVDEAHSIGTLGRTGRGLAEHWGVEPAAVDIVMGTLSKSFGSCGGFIAGSEELVALLRTYAPGLLLYSTGISPANTAAALEALAVLQSEPERVERLQGNARRFCAAARERGLATGEARGLAPIVPIVIGRDMRGMRVAARLFAEGVLAHPIIYPVVPRDAACIRFFITAMHEAEQMTRALDIIAEAMLS